ncbi:MAG: methionine-gamma-lyase [Sphingobacteriales bacterium]|jgi:methionine-gamma-lyase
MSKNESRFPWWESWIEKKHRYAQADEKFLDEDRFHSICVGNGLPDISQRSTFNFQNAKDGANRFLGNSPSGEKPFARIYTRLGNPNTEYLEKVLFQLECDHIIQNALAADDPEPTIGSLVFASGMAAISTTIMAFIKPGDALVYGNVYGCTDSFLRYLESRFGIEALFVDTTDLAAVEAIFEKHDNIAGVLLESPVNPTLEVSDIEAISKITEKHEAILMVDNTFCSPFLQQPFRLGADIVFHSLTKFINGHSTTIAGAAMGPFEFFSTDVFLAYKDFGPTPSPFDSWLNSLSVQDLGLRVKFQSETADKLATFLEAHPKVASVIYPGLESFKGKATVAKQMKMGGSLISFELKGGLTSGEKLMDYFARQDTPMELCVSLGGLISYIQHPASMTHSVVPEQARCERGITDGLVRLSVGAEGLGTLTRALEEGLSLI